MDRIVEEIKAIVKFNEKIYGIWAFVLADVYPREFLRVERVIEIKKRANQPPPFIAIDISGVSLGVLETIDREAREGRNILIAAIPLVQELIVDLANQRFAHEKQIGDERIRSLSHATY